MSCSSGFGVIFLLVISGPTAAEVGEFWCMSVNGLFAGAYLHADDTRTLANSSESFKAQIREVTEFQSTEQNFLVLNPNKCEILCKSGDLHCSCEG